MNRLTRISSILIHLQSKRIVTAKEVAERFEISLRTVYRDIKTLQDAGVPIGSEPGVGYFIMEGYSLPPVMVTEEEANALLIAEKMVLNQGDLSLIEDFNSLMIKIKSTLKNFQKEKIESLKNKIVATVTDDFLKSKWLSNIQKAVANRTVVEINYHSIYKDEKTKRRVEPLGIYFNKNVWIMVGFCQFRLGIREFRLDRILSLFPMSSEVTYFEEFEMSEYFRTHSQQENHEN